MPTQSDNSVRIDLQLEQAIQAVLSDRPIAYHASLARALGSVTAGVLLSQFLYWQPRSRDPDGWFWKTQVDIADETALSRTETETARKVLVRAGVVEEKRRGVPAKMHFRVNLTKVVELLGRAQRRGKDEPSPRSAPVRSAKGNPQASQFAGILQTRLRDSANQDSGVPANQSAGMGQTNTETTPETSSDTTAETTNPKGFEGQTLHINEKNLHFREKKNFENLSGDDKITQRGSDHTALNQDDGLTPVGEVVKTRRNRASQSASERPGTAATPKADSIAISSERGPSGRLRAGGRRSLADQAPSSIATVMEQTSGELYDEHQRSSLSRAVKLWQQSRQSESAFIAAIYAARKIAKQQGHIAKRAAGEAGEHGLKNRMPYFMRVLEDQLGLKHDAPHPS